MINTGVRCLIADHTNSVRQSFSTFLLMSIGTSEKEHKTKYRRNRSCRCGPRIENTENDVVCNTNRLGLNHQVLAGLIRKYRFKDNNNFLFSGKKRPQSRFI